MASVGSEESLRQIRDQRFSVAWLEAATVATVEPTEFINCTFEASSVSVGVNATSRERVAGHRFVSCSFRGGGVYGLEIEDCTVDDARIPSLPGVAGCVFRHVTLRGRISKLIIHSEMSRSYHPESFDHSAAKYYDTVDWALDIVALDCADFNLRGLPARLVRRDSPTQVVISKDVAMSGDWRSIDFSGVHFHLAIQTLQRKDWEDVILVASRTGKRSQRDLEVLNDLRAAGLTTE